jgi:hypothetical protein
MYTEADAKTKWCPFARALVSISPLSDPTRHTAIASANRGNNAELLGWCVGSACMAWRWNDGLDLIDSMVAERNGSRRGYCGASGNPKAGAA